MSTQNVADLLRRGIDAAREGRKNEARELFEQVVELDEKNEKGWFWLASVVDTDEERRICLSNVLHINPNNERAKRAMDALQEKAKEKKAAADEEEVVAGVTRRQMTMIIGVGAVVVILILVIALVVIVGNNNRAAAEQASQTAVAVAATQNALAATQSAIEATVNAEAATATQLAIATPTPSETPTPLVATLPPEWTPTPEATALPTHQALPAPLGLSGKLAVWSGQDLLNTGFLPVGYYDLNFGNQYHQIGRALGSDITFGPTGQRVVYTANDQLLFSSTIELININGTEFESLPNRWQGQNVFEPQMPNWGGPSGRYVTFVALTESRNTPQVFLLDMNAPQDANPLRQLTDDDSTYRSPAISPDGSKVAAVRANENSANPTVDIVSIDVATGGQVPITNDGLSYTEETPRWTRDGSQIVFAATPSNEPGNSDIYIRNSNGTGSSLPFYRSPGNDIRPVLSPDGRYLAFASNVSGAYDIYIYDRNEDTLYQLTNTREADYPGDWWQ